MPNSEAHGRVADADGDETRREAVAQSRSESAYDADYAAAEQGPDDADVRARSDLLPEERAAGSDDPEAQARAILEDSLLRTEVPGTAPSTHLEHRRSEDTV
jgi:hypothetical protein